MTFGVNRQSTAIEATPRFQGMSPEMFFQAPSAGSWNQMFFPAAPLVTAKKRLVFFGSIANPTTFPTPEPSNPVSFSFQLAPSFAVVQTCPSEVAAYNTCGAEGAMARAVMYCLPT